MGGWLGLDLLISCLCCARLVEIRGISENRRPPDLIFGSVSSKRCPMLDAVVPNMLDHDLHWGGLDGPWLNGEFL